VGSVLLDAVRGVAALLVCAYHVRYLLLMDYSQLTAHRRLWLLPYVVCGLGHQAVLVFFVLSGYLVGGSTVRSIERGSWTWRGYLLHRGVRLWLVLLPALLIGGAIDATALHLHLAPGLYGGLVPNHITFDVRPNLTWKAFFGSLFFVQKILTPVFGSNGALWSLAYEFWYYLIFPLGLLAVRGRYSAVLRISCAVGFLAACRFVGHDILMLLPVWLLGALLAVVPVRANGARLRWLAVALYCPFFVAFSRGDPMGLNLRDYAIAVGTFALLWVLLGAQEPYGKEWFVRPSREAAGFSYTLYLFHTPLLMVLAALLVGDSRWIPTAGHAAAALGCLALAVGLAYPIARLTEFHTAEVRDWLARALP
jgi:peptidoglycan/LPS O-acetylase OafA/YrhL